MKWDAAQSAALATLWGEGLSTMKIAKLLGITKNSVVGRAHRLNLEGRASPLLPALAPRPVVLHAPKVTLPALPSERMEASRIASRKTTEDQEARIWIMSGNGKSDRSIAKKMEVSVDVIRRVLGKAAYQRGSYVAPVPKPKPPAPVQRTMILKPGLRCEYLDGDEKPYIRCTANATRGAWCAEHYAVCYE